MPTNDNEIAAEYVMGRMICRYILAGLIVLGLSCTANEYVSHHHACNGQH